MKTLLIVIGVLLISSNSFAADSIRYNRIKWNADGITCKLDYAQISGFRSKRKNKAELITDSFECPESDAGCNIIFADLNSSNPMMLSTGVGPVKILERSKDSKFLLIGETTSYGTLNLFRIELKTGLIVETKNAVDIKNAGNLYGAVYVGQCKQLKRGKKSISETGGFDPNKYLASKNKEVSPAKAGVSSTAMLPEHSSNEYIYSFTKDYVESLHLASEGPSNFTRVASKIQTSGNPNTYIAMLSSALESSIETLKRAKQMMAPYLQSSNGFVKLIADNTILACSSLIDSYEVTLRLNNKLLAAKTEAQVRKINKEMENKKKSVVPAWKALGNSSVLLTQCMVGMGSKGRDKPDTLMLSSKQRKYILKMLTKYYGSVIKGGKDEDLVMSDIPAAVLWAGVENKNFKSYKN